MSRVVILGCVALALLAGLNLWTWRQLTTERRETGALREQLARVRNAPVIRAAPKALEIVKTAPSSDARELPQPPGLDGAFNTNMEELFQDPEYLRAWRTQARASTEELYPDVQRVLKLSPGARKGVGRLPGKPGVPGRGESPARGHGYRTEWTA